MNPTELDGMAEAFDRWLRVVIGLVGLAVVVSGFLVLVVG